jgi:SAM-dependent methyltransferase
MGTPPTLICRSEATEIVYVAVAAPEIYGTARGPLPRLVEPYAQRARARRHARFLALIRPTGLRIVDVGCGALGLRGLSPDLDITGVDLVERPGYPGPFARADAAEGLPFADDEFDLAYCSSVIEHVPRARRDAFAGELRRVARGWYVQTPAWSFPLEPHSLLPGAQWLPVGLRRPYWRLGAAGGWEEIDLLRRREVEALFGPANPERFGPFAKSWISIVVP